MRKPPHTGKVQRGLEKLTAPGMSDVLDGAADRATDTGLSVKDVVDARAAIRWIYGMRAWRTWRTRKLLESRRVDVCAGELMAYGVAPEEDTHR